MRIRPQRLKALFLNPPHRLAENAFLFSILLIFLALAIALMIFVSSLSKTRAQEGQEGKDTKKLEFSKEEFQQLLGIFEAQEAFFKSPPNFKARDIFTPPLTKE